MKPLVLQFQEDLVSGQKPIGDLLRMAKMIAVKLGQEDLCEWFDHELKGYPTDAALPHYRFVSGGQLEFQDPHFGWCQAVVSSMSEFPIRGPITELAVFTPKDHFYVTPFRKYPLIDEDGNSEPIMRYPQRIEFPIATILGMVEGVKDKLVDWSVELEKQGILGKDMSFREDEKASAKSLVFNIGSMSGGFIGDPSHSTVQVTSYGNVMSLLESSGISQTEKEELKQILQDLERATPEERPKLREKIGAWVAKNGEFIGTALDGLLKTYTAP